MQRSNETLLCISGLIVSLALMLAGVATGLVPVEADGEPCGTAFIGNITGNGESSYCSAARWDRLPMPIALLTMGAVIGVASLIGMPSEREPGPQASTSDGT